MKILCTADIHIGQQAYSVFNHNTGLNSRTEYTLNIFDNMIDYCIENCEVFIMAGDMFKNALPTPTLQNEVYKRIKRLSDNNIKVFLLDGNHDVSKLETSKSALKAVNTFDLPNITHTRFYREEIYNNINFVMLPTYATREEIQNLIKGIVVPNTIVIGHFTVLGAKLNDWLIDKNETNVSLDDLKNDNIKAVILGHLHKHQILQNTPLTLYTGSPDRIDFGEENDDKGFVVLDTDDYSYEFIHNNAQQFKTIMIDISDLEQEINIDDYIHQHLKDFEDCITRVIITLNKNQTFDEKVIYKTLENAKYVLNIQKRYKDKVYLRDTEIKSSLSIEQNLELYYKDKEREKERIELGKTIIQSVNIY